MTSLLSTDSSAPSLSSSPHDMDEVLTGLRHITETSDSHGKRLIVILSILLMQAKEIKKRDKSIIIMQSKLDSQQAIMEQIRSEQQQLISAIASFLNSNAQHASAELSPPVILDMPEPKTPAANPERSPSVFSVPELLSSQKTPTPAFLPSYRNSIPVVHADLKAATADNRWKAPQHYMKTQRGIQLRRQGAFYDTPDWGTMTVISSAVPDAPPSSSPASPHTQEEVTSTTGNLRADARALVEVEHDLRAAAADNRWKAPQHYMNIQKGGQLRRQGAFYGTPDWDTMTLISSAVPDAPPSSSPASPHTQEEVTSTAGKSRADVRALVEVEQETDAAVDGVKAAVSNKGDRVSDASSRTSCKRCRDPDEQEARKAANRMNISSIVHTAPDAPSKRRRVSRDIVESDTVSDVKRSVRRSLRHG